MGLHPNGCNPTITIKRRLKVTEKSKTNENTIEYGETPQYQCVICGNWDDDTEHIKNNPEWFEALWDVTEMDQMRPIVWVTPQNELETTIHMHNMTKPFVCVQCMIDECGTIN